MVSKPPNTKNGIKGLLLIYNEDGYNANNIEIPVTTDRGPTKVCFNLEVQKTTNLFRFDIHSLGYEKNPEFGEIVQTLKEENLDKNAPPYSSILGGWDPSLRLDNSRTNRICVPRDTKYESYLMILLLGDPLS
jgi:hypothetical protein